jgi:hypothetical protein
MAILDAPGLNSPSAGVCPACHHPSSSPFLRIERVPVFCNVLHASASTARDAPCSVIDLVLCERCAVIYNARFDPALVQYSPGYQNPLHVSECFRGFAEELSSRLVRHHHLFGGTAIEIGCGDGFFLERLVESGMHKGIGYDPTMGEGTSARKIPSVQIVPELFNVHQSAGAVDAIICRHVFEHLANPREFLAGLRNTAGRQTLMYFEVPNATRMLESVIVWDVIFEHFTYWTSAALSALFVRCGFNPLSVSTDFGSQFLMLEARPSPWPSQRSWPTRAEVRATRDQCSRFGEASTKLISCCRTELRNLRAQGRKAVVWGAGSKGITFANVVAGHEPLLAGIIDINPEKQGKYVAFSGFPVLAPSQLNDLRPDRIILMNENYTLEVAKLLKEFGVTADIQSISQFSKTSRKSYA